MRYLKRWFFIVCIIFVSLSIGIGFYVVTVAQGEDGSATSSRTAAKSAIVGTSEAKKKSPEDKEMAKAKEKGEQSIERAILDLVNRERAKEGKSALEWNDQLYKVAAIRVEEISTKFSHERPNGSSCFTAFDQVGASYWYAAENIAVGQTSAESVMKAWMNSPGHKKNILGEGKSFGCSVIKNPHGQGYCFAQEFGTLQ